jgi:uncharacterized protein
VYQERGGFLQRHTVSIYFALTFAISWLGALVVAAPSLIRGEPASKAAGLVIFPVMLLGPTLAGLILTRVVDGASGMRDLLFRMSPARVPIRWYAPLLIPPVLILAVLFCLKALLSARFTPNAFALGVLFGCVAGFFEEIGWTGYAFPKMIAKHNPLAATLSVGLLWCVWHLPAINYLGSATPHGAYWFRYFLAFTAAMIPLRVLICWIYVNTKSVLLAQMMHASSTGSLVVFSPVAVTPRDETIWYVFYAAALWIAVAIILRASGARLMLVSAVSGRP